MTGRAAPAGLVLGLLAVAGCVDLGAPLPASDAGNDGGTDAAPIAPCPTGEELDAGSISFANDVQPIFDQYCASGACHSVAVAAAGQVLAAGASHSSIVGVPAFETTMTSGMNRIEPFDPDASYLVHKLVGTHAEPPALGNGERMPRGFVECLDPAYIAAIKNWVSAGALDD